MNEGKKYKEGVEILSKYNPKFKDGKYCIRNNLKGAMALSKADLYDLYWCLKWNIELSDDYTYVWKFKDNDKIGGQNIKHFWTDEIE